MKTFCVITILALFCAGSVLAGGRKPDGVHVHSYDYNTSFGGIFGGSGDPARSWIDNNTGHHIEVHCTKPNGQEGRLRLSPHAGGWMWYRCEGFWFVYLD